KARSRARRRARGRPRPRRGGARAASRARIARRGRRARRRHLPQAPPRRRPRRQAQARPRARLVREARLRARLAPPRLAPPWSGPDSVPEGPSSPSSGEDATNRFAAWERLVDYVAVRDRLFAGSAALTVLLQMALDADAEVVEPTRSNFFAALAERTGWSAAD